jgi:hypothetical protein
VLEGARLAGDSGTRKRSERHSYDFGWVRLASPSIWCQLNHAGNPKDSFS